MKEKIGLGRNAKIITAVETAVMIFLCSLPIWLPLSTLWIAIPIFGIAVWKYGFAPLSVAMNDNALVIHSLLKNRTIPYSEIKDSKRITNPDLSWDMVSSLGITKGFMGYWGLYRSRTLGEFDSYVGYKPDSILLLMKEGHPVLFSCNNPDRLFSFLKESIRTSC